MIVSTIKCDLFVSTSKPAEIEASQSITIDPSAGLTITGERIIDGKIIAIYATKTGLDADEFLVFGSNFGTGLVGYGYGYGYSDGGDGDLDYFSTVQYRD